MRVLLLSAADIKGGAAKVAHDLATGLIDRDVHVELHARHCSSGSPFVRQLPEWSVPQRNLLRRLIFRFGLPALSLNSPHPFHLTSKFLRTFDIIHLHDLPPHFNYAGFPWLCRQRPVAWTLHSMAPFTGGCSYSYACNRFQRTCGKCPQFGKWPLDWLSRDSSRAINILKRTAFAVSPFTCIGVSDWIADQARSSMLGRKPIHVIPNPVDTVAFHVRDKAAAKAALGIPPDRFTLLFAVAGNTKDTRKGLDIILNALPQVQAKRPFLLPTAVTEPDENFREIMAKFDSLPPRHLQGNAELASYYQAADAVWHPTRADTSSLVSLEAMACGTPVIAAAVGGVPGIVRHEYNGLLIPVADPAALAAATIRMMEDPQLQSTLAAQARAFVVENHSMALFVDRHLQLYHSLAGQ